jgi:hypothetical protein
MASSALTVTQAVEPDMDDDEILALIEEEIAVSVSFDNDPDEDSRSVALEYYDASRSRMNRDVPFVDGWSQINAKTVPRRWTWRCRGSCGCLMPPTW